MNDHLSDPTRSYIPVNGRKGNYYICNQTGRLMSHIWKGGNGKQWDPIAREIARKSARHQFFDNGQRFQMNKTEAAWLAHGGTLPGGCTVHTFDGNHTDLRLENLFVTTN